MAPTASPVYQGGQSVTGLPTSYTRPAVNLDIGSLFRPNPIAQALFNYVFNEEDNECPNNLPDFDFESPANHPIGQDGLKWPWHGKQPQGGKFGGYKNPNGPESIHPDLDHGEPIGPHWDFNDRKGPGWRIYPNGGVKKKGK
ncbi:hypothetical protein PARC_a3070 [Pseudoalteromonas arctica A 37-1-2]|uniref:Uncharacterized protein n=1 Tax=Pseudoalteromonas arctica A 37-1-2 TaxID=1117313 RepID=A0A290S903_9GAMM|nr:hypothetical protein PARC_a3070 [Pseudoalteromonas arctica A 37-1-2]